MKRLSQFSEGLAAQWLAGPALERLEQIARLDEGWRMGEAGGYTVERPHRISVEWGDVRLVLERDADGDWLPVRTERAPA